MRAAEPIRVLIVDGFSNHDWARNTALLRGILEPTQRFAIDVSTAPPTALSPGWEAWRPRFKDYAVVIQMCNDIRQGPSWPSVVQQDFEAYVRQGGSVYVYHSGNNAFLHWPAYNQMIGLAWRKADFGVAITVEPDGSLRRIPAGEGKNTGHGPRSTVLIQRRGDHPIHEGFPRQWLTPDLEIYTYARGPAENLEVLSYAYDAPTGMSWPIEWTVTFGRGKIYTSTFGHVMATPRNPESLRCAGFQTLTVRALQWLAGVKPDFPIPPDFPTAEKPSVRKEIE